MILRSVTAGIAALGMGVAVKSGAMPAGPADAGLQGGRPGISVFGTIHPKLLAVGHPVGSQMPTGRGVRLASLDMPADATAAERMPAGAAAAARQRASFQDRFASFFDGRGAAVSHVRASLVTMNPPAGATGPSSAPARPRAHRVPVPDPLRHKPASPAAGQPAPESASRKLVRTAYANNSTPPADDSRTAIYDISAHAVYLPNGDKLEAHSGLGSHLDDPRQVSLKGRGPTPPNVYQLAMRERLFHGVRAIRLIPVGDGEMYGRDGILAHSYMLGPNGQSNGCMSVSNYPAFLNAFMKGEIDRLVVVEHLATAPSSRTGLGWLLPEPLRKLLM